MPPSNELNRDRGGLRRWISTGVSLVVVAGLVALAVAKMNLSGVGHSLANVKPGWLILALLCMSTAFVARAESWYAVVSAALPSAQLGRGVIRRGLFIGMIGSTVAPGRVGEAARALVITRRLRHPRRELAVVVGTLISQTLINLGALVLLTLIALAGGRLSSARVGALILAVALPLGLVALLVAGPRVLGRLAASRLRWLALAGGWLAVQAAAVRRGLRTFVHVSTAAHASAFQLLAWALQLVMCWVTLLALGIHAHQPVAAAAAVLVAVNLTAIVPITPSNVGVFQAATIAVLAPFGVSAAEGLAYGLVLQAVEILSAVALGVPALMREGLSFTRPDQPRDPESDATSLAEPGGAGDELPPGG